MAEKLAGARLLKGGACRSGLVQRSWKSVGRAGLGVCCRLGSRRGVGKKKKKMRREGEDGCCEEKEKKNKKKK